MAFEVMTNAAANAMGGAGIQAAQSLAGKGIEAVITGNVGPNAFQTLSAAGIKIATGASGTIREAIVKFNKGELSNTGAPTVRGHFGMGKGRGRGQGRRRSR
jgi:predicted Fe-Mo cluster-binding NifX family protein